MSDDPQGAGREPEDELELPEENREEEGLRQRKPVPIPKPTRTSGMVRRQVSVGDLKRSEPEPFRPREAEVPRPRPTPEPEARPDREREPEPKRERPIVREGREIAEGLPPQKPIAARAEPPAASPADQSHAVGSAVAQKRRRRTREPEGEEAWTGNRSSLWFVLAGLCCLAVVGYFLKSSFTKESPGEEVGEPVRQEFKGTLEEIPIAEFVERSAELLPIVSNILDQVYAAEGEVKAELLRGGAESAAIWKAWRGRGVKPARHRPINARQLHAAAVGGTGYLVLAGLNADHLVAATYFTKEGEEFKYDWQASEGYSELLPTEVEALADDEPKLMRAVVTPSSFYTTHFPEAEYRCYSFHHQDPGQFVWGFARRSSLVDRSLMTSYKAKDLAGTEGRVTIKVRRGPDGARANQLEVVEFLHTDWLTP